MTKDFADNIITQLELDYDHIANQFSDTRHEAWPEFGSLRALKSAEDAEPVKLLDIGCANGRLLNYILKHIPAMHYTGLDLSRQLLTVAKKNYPEYDFVHGSILKLPFNNESFDVVACVATLQHVPSLTYRQQAIRELVRVLKPGGTLFVLNWNLAEQARYQQYRAKETDGYDAGDYLIPWKNGQGEILAQRYYHGFGITELTELMELAELQIVKNVLGENNRNIVTIARRHP